MSALIRPTAACPPAGLDAVLGPFVAASYLFEAWVAGLIGAGLAVQDVLTHTWQGQAEPGLLTPVPIDPSAPPPARATFARRGWPSAASPARSAGPTATPVARAERPRVSVVRQGDPYAVLREGAGQASAVCDSLAEAVGRAREIAHNEHADLRLPAPERTRP